MQPDEVLEVIGALTNQELAVWIDGGWGVDALLGEVSRQHEDVDLVVELGALPRIFECLATLGFLVTEDHAPVRVVLHSIDSRQIDLHPVTFDQDGTGWQIGAGPDGADCPYPQSGFGLGTITGIEVPCLTADLQLAHHCGYEPRERDRLDMARLAKRFGLKLSQPY